MKIGHLYRIKVERLGFFLGSSWGHSIHLHIDDYVTVLNYGVHHKAESPYKQLVVLHKDGIFNRFMLDNDGSLWFEEVT